MDGLTTLDVDSHKAPEERIANAIDARKIITALKEAEQTRSRKRARIQGMIDGNPPFSSRLLRDKGQGHRTNFNTRDAEGMADSAKTPYYDLVFEVPQFAEIYIEYGDNADRNFEWGQSISKRYDSMLDEWRGMDAQFQIQHWQMCVNGHGPMIWQDAKNWRSKAVKVGQFLVPDETEADLDQIETAGRPRSILPGDLYRFIKDEKAAKVQGWNVGVAQQAIIDAATEPPAALRDWEYWQAQLRQGDVTFNAKSKKIFVFDLFQKEFDGKISHYILLDTDSANSTGTGKPLNPKSEFLFKKIGRFDCFDQIICPFFFDVGPDGDWHSIKGLGPKIFDFCDSYNQLTCAMIDGAKIGSGITLEAADANALEQTQIVHIGGGAVVQPGYKIVQSRIAESLQGPLAVKHDLQSTLQSNTGQYRQRVSEENQEPTLGQAQLNARQQAVLGKGAVNRYYKTLDGWHRETLRRALKMGVALYQSRKDDMPEDDYSDNLNQAEKGAWKFVRDCVMKDKVPVEVLNMEYVCSITATRAVGYGSPQMQEVVTNGLMQLLPMLTEQGRNSVLRRRAALLVGQANVDSIVEPFEQADVPNDHVWAATVENNALREMGGDVILTIHQNHAIHFSEHSKDVQLHIQQIQDGQSDEMKLLIHLEQAGPHMTAHLAHLQGDPTRKNMVSQMRQQLAAMAKLTDQLKQKLFAQAKQQAQGAQQQQPDPEMLKVAGELKLKGAKQQGEMQLKAQKQAQAMKLADAKTAHALRTKDAKTAHDISTDDVKTDHALATENTKTAHEIATTNMQTLHDIQIARLEAATKKVQDQKPVTE